MEDTMVPLPPLRTRASSRGKTDSFLLQFANPDEWPQSKAMTHIERIIEELWKFEVADEYTCLVGVFLLNGHTVVSTSTSAAQRDQWIDRLAKAKYCRLVEHLWPGFIAPNYVLQEGAVMGWQGFQYCMIIVWNCTDVHPQTCVDVCEGSLIEDMLSMLRREDIDPKRLKEDKERAWLVKALLGIMHNCLRHNQSKAKLRLREHSVVSTVGRFVDSTNALARVKAAMVLAFCVDEGEKHLLKYSDQIFKPIIDGILKPALKRENRRSLGFAVEETLEALNELARHDNNKLAMVKHGLVDVYASISSSSTASAAEVRQAVGGLWQLSFVDEGRTAIKLNDACLKDLTTKSTHENKAISRAAKGTLWNLDDKAEGRGTSTSSSSVSASKAATRKPSRNGSKHRPKKESGKTKREDKAVEGHVMISYDHHHKEVVHQLNAALRRLGYVTWLDVEQMKGSTLEAMAAAVEDSLVVVMCFSQRYQESPNCRSEAEYAWQLRKSIVPVRTERCTPSGWLGMMIGSKMFFTCITDADVQLCAKKVADELGARGREGGNPQRHRNMVRSLDANPVKEMVGSLDAKPVKELGDWTREDVQKWLADNKLGHIGPQARRIPSIITLVQLNRFDGVLLGQLCRMYINSPGAAFYQSTKEFLKIDDLPDLLTLSALLEKL